MYINHVALWYRFLIMFSFGLLHSWTFLCSNASNLYHCVYDFFFCACTDDAVPRNLGQSWRPGVHYRVGSSAQSAAYHGKSSDFTAVLQPEPSLSSPRYLRIKTLCSLCSKKKKKKKHIRWTCFSWEAKIRGSVWHQAGIRYYLVALEM